MSDETFEYPMTWDGWRIEREIMLPDHIELQLGEGQRLAGGPWYVLDMESDARPLFMIPSAFSLMRHQAETDRNYTHRFDELLGELALMVLSIEEKAMRQGIDHGRRQMRVELQQLLGVDKIVGPLEAIAEALQERGA